MSKLMSSIKKHLALLTVGGSAFFFLGSPGCHITNGNLAQFYTDVGGAGIQSLANSAGGVLGADADAIVIQPAAGFLSNVWGNWVGASFPADPTFGSPFVR